MRVSHVRSRQVVETLWSGLRYRAGGAALDEANSARRLERTVGSANRARSRSRRSPSAAATCLNGTAPARCGAERLRVHLEAVDGPCAVEDALALHARARGTGAELLALRVACCRRAGSRRLVVRSGSGLGRWSMGPVSAPKVPDVSSRPTLPSLWLSLRHADLRLRASAFPSPAPGSLGMAPPSGRADPRFQRWGGRTPRLSLRSAAPRGSGTAPLRARA